jgi:hypothetical protein
LVPTENMRISVLDEGVYESAEVLPISGKNNITFGRVKDCDVVFKGDAGELKVISKRHFSISNMNGKYLVKSSQHFAFQPNMFLQKAGQEIKIRSDDLESQSLEEGDIIYVDLDKTIGFEFRVLETGVADDWKKAEITLIYK